MGCTEVCASANFAAASMNMPFLSYECAGRKLSSEVDYEGFTRMGTPLVQSMEMLDQLVTQYGWGHVAIVSADPAKWRDQTEYYQAGLLAAGVPTSYYSSYDATLEETLAMVSAFVADKRRVVLMLGDEGFMRRVICGTRVAGANVGLAWIYEGISSHQWWAADDSTLMALRGHSADGVCALAKTMAHFLQSHTVDDLRNPSTELYNEFVSYMKTGLAFQGVSGWVNFTGNDKPESVAMKQVRGEEFVTIGLAFPNGTTSMEMNGGLANDSWTAAKDDVEDSFNWLIFKIITPLLCVCCPAIAGCIRQS